MTGGVWSARAWWLHGRFPVPWPVTQPRDSPRPSSEPRDGGAFPPPPGFPGTRTSGLPSGLAPRTLHASPEEPPARRLDCPRSGGVASGRATAAEATSQPSGPFCVRAPERTFPPPLKKPARPAAVSPPARAGTGAPGRLRERPKRGPVGALLTSSATPEALHAPHPQQRESGEGSQAPPPAGHRGPTCSSPTPTPQAAPPGGIPRAGAPCDLSHTRTDSLFGRKPEVLCPKHQSSVPRRHDALGSVSVCPGPRSPAAPAVGGPGLH